MIKLLTVSACCILFSISINAQSFVSLSTGISKDVSNNTATFYHIPITVQWKPFRKHWSVLFLESNYDIPFTGSSTGTAYTLNPSLPQSVTVKEKIRPYVFTQFAGASFRFYTDTIRKDILYVNPMFGICSQTFSVEYTNYDSKNYEILNPDVNLNAASLVVAVEVAYKFHNNLMIMLHAQTGMLAGRGSYPLSYRFIAPMQLNFGYTFSYNKQPKRRTYGRY
jgi:hypothetical protein